MKGFAIFTITICTFGLNDLEVITFWPIIVETTGLYGVRKDVLKINRSRIGNNPFFYEVSDEESIDLDNEEDFKLLEYYVSKNNLNW